MKKVSIPWIYHPRLKKPDTMLTLSVLSVLICSLKFIFSGIVFTVGNNFTFNFGTIDAGVIAALLTPTLGAYVARKYSDSPDKGKNNEKK